MNNTIFIADSLKISFPAFFQSFTYTLKRYNISVLEILGTNDVWARDYMPVRVSDEKLVLFRYEPDYLNEANWSILKSDNKIICSEMEIKAIYSDLIIDAGNVVKYNGNAILTDKIFKENLRFSKKVILDKLMSLLEVNRLIIIPTLPGDWIGHADGMVRFVDEKTVLVSDFSMYSCSFNNRLNDSLIKSGLKVIKMPYVETGLKNSRGELTAIGCYINYLQVEDIIFCPVFDLEVDNLAIKTLETNFKCKVVPVFSNEIALHGGVLNCITWN